MTTEQMRREFDRYWLARQRKKGFGNSLTDAEMLVHPERQDDEFHAWQAGKLASQRTEEQAAQPVAVSPSLAFQVAQRIYSETPNDAMPEPQILLTGSELVRLVTFFATPHLPVAAPGWWIAPDELTPEMQDAGCPVGEVVDHFDIKTAWRAMRAASIRSTL